MARLTFISQQAAREGYQFIHEGPLTQCQLCTYAPICHGGLKPRGVYRVARIREKTANCPAIAQVLQLVEVDEGTLTVNIQARLAIEGISFVFTGQPCDAVACPHFDRCVPAALENGRRCKLKTVDYTFTCPKYSTRLAAAQVQPL